MILKGLDELYNTKNVVKGVDWKKTRKNVKSHMLWCFKQATTIFCGDKNSFEKVRKKSLRKKLWSLESMTSRSPKNNRLLITCGQLI